MTLLDLLLDADQIGPYDDSEKLWLHCYKRNPLLHTQPLLLLLVQYYAEKQRWSPKQRFNVAMLPDVETILQQLELPRHERTCWLCQHVTELSESCEVVHYAQSELKALYLCFQNGSWAHVETRVIKPSVEFVMGLAKLLSKHPELASARFIQRSQRSGLCFDLAEFKILLIKQAAKRLQLADVQKKLLRCRHTRDLNHLQRRLEHQLSEQLLSVLQAVDLDDLASVYEASQPFLSESECLELEDHWYDRYPVLAWANPPDIVQLTDYPALFLEAHQQHNCALTYRHQLESQDYAMFKVLHPERATLGLQWQPKTQRFVIDELVAANNKDVSNATRRFVKRWLKLVQPTVKQILHEGQHVVPHRADADQMK